MGGVYFLLILSYAILIIAGVIGSVVIYLHGRNKYLKEKEVTERLKFQNQILKDENYFLLNFCKSVELEKVFTDENGMAHWPSEN
jgi:hypothetical protein